MIIVSPELEEVIEGRIVQIADRPIIFAQFLELGQPETWMELVNGVLEEKPMVQLDHELTEGWIYIVMRAYVQKRGLGMVVHSHFPVQINSFSGRLPDIVFVLQEQIHIVEQKAIVGVPNLVVEMDTAGTAT